MLPCHWGTWLFLPRLCLPTLYQQKSHCLGRQSSGLQAWFYWSMFLWQQYVCWGFVSAQEENLCMQRRGWTLVADFIISVCPHTVQTCDYKRHIIYKMQVQWCKPGLKGFSTLSCISLCQCYIGALLPESSWCSILPVYSEVTLCNFIMQWHKYHGAEALLSRKISSSSINNV